MKQNIKQVGTKKVHTPTLYFSQVLVTIGTYRFM